MKYSLPMAETLTLLEWGYLNFKDGYVAAGLHDMMCDMIRWPLEYFLKTWIPSKHTLYVQVRSASHSKDPVFESRVEGVLSS